MHAARINRKTLIFFGILLGLGLLTLAGLQLYLSRPIPQVPPIRREQLTTKEVIKLPVRLAILQRVGGNKPETLRAEVSLDLLTAELSQSQYFELIERQQIEKVFTELALSKAENLPPSEVVRAGQLLRADWFLVSTFFPNAETNLVVVKILDARTGIIRDLRSFEFNSANPITWAHGTALFTINSATNSMGLADRMFVGIGSFTDLSINDRYPDFSRQLRTKLEQAYEGSRVVIVERGLVHPLLEEMRLEANGFISASNRNTVLKSLARPAVYLVDGYFQSYQDEQAKVSLALRIHRIGRREQLFSITEPMGKGLVDKAVGHINNAIKGRTIDLNPARRRQEAAAQVKRGKEYADAPNFTLPPHLRISVEPEKARRRLLQAIDAFEAALFLQPDDEEAKVYLGACLAHPLMS